MYRGEHWEGFVSWSIFAFCFLQFSWFGVPHLPAHGRDMVRMNTTRRVPGLTFRRPVDLFPRLPMIQQNDGVGSWHREHPRTAKDNARRSSESLIAEQTMNGRTAASIRAWLENYRGQDRLIRTLNPNAPIQAIQSIFSTCAAFTFLPNFADKLALGGR